jgi:hypothetical protein
VRVARDACGASRRGVLRGLAEAGLGRRGRRRLGLWWRAPPGGAQPGAPGCLAARRRLRSHQEDFGSPPPRAVNGPRRGWRRRPSSPPNAVPSSPPNPFRPRRQCRTRHGRGDAAYRDRHVHPVQKGTLIGWGVGWGSVAPVY